MPCYIYRYHASLVAHSNGKVICSYLFIADELVYEVTFAAMHSLSDIMHSTPIKHGMALLHFDINSYAHRLVSFARGL